MDQNTICKRLEELDRIAYIPDTFANASVGEQFGYMTAMLDVSKRYTKVLIENIRSDQEREREAMKKCVRKMIAKLEAREKDFEDERN